MRRTRSPLHQPLCLFAAYVVVALGTMFLDQSLRYALLWSVLVLLSVLYRGAKALKVEFTLAAVGRGTLLGLVASTPVLAFLSGHLRTAVVRLYGTGDVASLLYQVCFVAAPVEEWFVRGIIQPQSGLWPSIAVSAVIGLLTFLTRAPVLVLALVVAYTALTSMVYAYVRDRHGLAASIACHVCIGFVLQVLPSVLGALQTAPV